MFAILKEIQPQNWKFCSILIISIVFISDVPTHLKWNACLSKYDTIAELATGQVVVFWRASLVLYLAFQTEPPNLFYNASVWHCDDFRHKSRSSAILIQPLAAMSAVPALYLLQISITGLFWQQNGLKLTYVCARFSHEFFLHIANPYSRQATSCVRKKIASFFV